MEKIFKVIVLFLLYSTQKSRSENECKLKSVHIVRKFLKIYLRKLFNIFFNAINENFLSFLIDVETRRSCASQNLSFGSTHQRYKKISKRNITID